MFSANTYIERRNKLKEKVGSGIILLMGNDESSINFKANWYHFRQDSSFLYFFGINLPGLNAIINCDSGEEIIFGNELSMDDIVWTGSQPTISELAEKCGVAKTLPTSKISGHLGNNTHFLPPYRADNTNKISAWLNIPINTVSEHTSVALIKAIVSIRSYKTAEEIEEINKATTITGNMHLSAMRYTQPGMVEAEVVGKIHQVAIAGGGNISFPPIFTKNGQILHNHFHGNTLKEGDLVLCDCGAETAMGYAGDMTRTFPAGNQFTNRQKEIYQIVLNAHNTAAEALAPGKLYRDIHLKASETIAQGLIDVGLMKGNAQEAVQAGAHALFFQHGLGHMMGLDVHDMEDLGEEYVGYTDTLKKSKEFGIGALRLGKTLEPGFVLTVEPGIYLIPQLIEQWQAENKLAEFINYEKVADYKDFGGIRIEEDFLITDGGSELLGEPVAKSIADVEQIRAESLELSK